MVIMIIVIMSMMEIMFFIVVISIKIKEQLTLLEVQSQQVGNISTCKRSPYLNYGHS